MMFLLLTAKISSIFSHSTVISALTASYACWEIAPSAMLFGIFLPSHQQQMGILQNVSLL